MNKKNKNINTEITLEVITQLSMLPLEYNGDIKYLKTKSDIFTIIK